MPGTLPGYTLAMPTLKLCFLAAQSALPLDRALADLLSLALGRKVGRAWARQLVVTRRVRRNMAPVGLNEPVRPGLLVTVQLSAEEMQVPLSTPVVEPRVVFRDQHWLAIDKPAGLLVHPGADKSRPDLVSLVAGWMGERPWTLHHRLDAETSGLVLFSLSLQARASVAAQFEERRVEKAYLCRIGPGHPAAWTCDAPLAERRGRVLVDAAGKPAFTEFRGLDSPGLIEARPRTGRKHQIRVHLASQGRPIVGDRLYGGADAPRLLLHAHTLRLLHPDGSLMTLTAPCPKDFSAMMS